MNPFELFFGSLLVACLLGLACFFAWRQRRTMALLQDQSLVREDRRYLTGQVIRRLLCSALMVVFAGFLVGSYFLEDERLRLQPPGPEATKQEKQASQDFIRFYAGYWIFAMLVLAGIMGLAGIDLVATMRFGFRHHQQLQRDHKEMLEAEAAAIRRRRAEMN